MGKTKLENGSARRKTVLQWFGIASAASALALCCFCAPVGLSEQAARTLGVLLAALFLLIFKSFNVCISCLPAQCCLRSNARAAFPWFLADTPITFYILWRPLSRYLLFFRNHCSAENSFGRSSARKKPGLSVYALWSGIVGHHLQCSGGRYFYSLCRKVSGIFSQQRGSGSAAQIQLVMISVVSFWMFWFFRAG